MPKRDFPPSAQLSFEWDDTKAKANRAKHDISFEEARTIFSDPFLLTFPDPRHSESEHRFLSIGLSASGRALIVVHTDREGLVRLISCRKATRKERRIYEETT